MYGNIKFYMYALQELCIIIIISAQSNRFSIATHFEV